jgi:hypothetical protein
MNQGRAPVLSDDGRGLLADHEEWPTKQSQHLASSTDKPRSQSAAGVVFDLPHEQAHWQFLGRAVGEAFLALNGGDDIVDD